MYFLIIIAILVALFALWFAHDAHIRIDNPPRSFLFTFYKSRGDNHLEHESVTNKINFYVLYLSGKRVFVDEHISEGINIHSKIFASEQTDQKNEIILESKGDVLRLQYITNSDKQIVEQGEDLYLNVLALPKSSKNQVNIEKYLLNNGWKIKYPHSSINCLCFSKGNFEVIVSYLS